MFGLRVRGVLRRQVPDSGLVEPQDSLQQDQEGEEGAAREGERGTQEQWQWQWLGRHGVYPERSDAADKAAAI